jgi:ATP-binding cassette, subfamily G (WHITE), member 2, PDR
MQSLGKIALISQASLLTSRSIQSTERQGLILLFCIEIFLFASSFAHMIIASLPDPQTAGALATLLFSMTMIFNG